MNNVNIEMGSWKKQIQKLKLNGIYSSAVSFNIFLVFRENVSLQRTTLIFLKFKQMTLLSFIILLYIMCDYSFVC